MTRVRLDLFDPSQGLSRGRPQWTEAAWYVVKVALFLSPFPWPSSWKAGVLRLFGAKVGRGLVLKPRVNIHLPWKLEIGDHCWVGEEVFILNLEKVKLGDHVCLSQRVFLCTGNHDYRSASFNYRNAAIEIGAGAWVGAQTFVGPGVSIGQETVVQAGSVVSASVPPAIVVGGNPALKRRDRWK